jgi:hypothetical protein
MKSNIKIIITAVIAIAIGLGAGYLIFGNKTNAVVPIDNHQQHGSEANSTSAPSNQAKRTWRLSIVRNGFDSLGS